MDANTRPSNDHPSDRQPSSPSIYASLFVGIAAVTIFFVTTLAVVGA